MDDSFCSSCRKMAASLPPLPWGYFKHAPDPFAEPGEKAFNIYPLVLWEYAFSEKCEHCFVRTLLGDTDMPLCWHCDYPVDPNLLYFYAYSLRWAWGNGKQETLRYLIPETSPHLKAVMTKGVLRKRVSEIVEILAEHPKAAREAAALIARAIWRHAQRERANLNLDPLVEDWLESRNEGSGKDPLAGLLRERDDE